MPIYSYHCVNCGEMELKRKIKDRHLDKCPECGDEDIRMIIPQTYITFKGDGFYHNKHRG